MISSLIPHLTVRDLAARAELACATIDLCDAYRETLLLCLDANDCRRFMHIGARETLMREHHAGQREAFNTAWRHGPSAVGNMRVIEAAVEGYAEFFNVGDHIKAAGERMLLDFMRGAVR